MDPVLIKDNNVGVLRDHLRRASRRCPTKYFLSTSAVIVREFSSTYRQVMLATSHASLP